MSTYPSGTAQHSESSKVDSVVIAVIIGEQKTGDLISTGNPSTTLQFLLFTGSMY